MTSPRDLLAPFDDDLVAEVSTEVGCTEADLRDGLREQQALARSLPGVDNLVYEWRRHFDPDPLVARRDDAYYLVVPTTVWSEFRPHLYGSAPVLDGVEEVHRRQLRRVLEREGGGGNAGRLDDGAAVVLTRK
ncbi:hypothetical protein VB773_11535 [Haloarculaceae archaeon H-GB2-1]|nr:hypothetical protein [Haloarculaceae archaeon H-GB1-1]MEA5386608.1 hypothetical protein [Haloarculaceae archaeon H-GB11]MEA5408125.1 hypothetical protein [Haloarculaceae archaeon H-GB2-1]